MAILLNASTWTDNVVEPATSSHVLLNAGNYFITTGFINISIIMGSVANDSFVFDFKSGANVFWRQPWIAYAAGVFTRDNGTVIVPLGLPLPRGNNISVGINSIAGAGSNIICIYTVELWGDILP